MIWREQLEWLLNVPYGGRGGHKALADVLGVTPESLARWHNQAFKATYEHREAIRQEFYRHRAQWDG